MRFKRERWPEVGELVLCTVKKITPYSAFVVLDEFKDKEGMIHITEISTRVVKNIREFLEEGQKVIAKVIRVNPSRKIIDLSLKRVKEFEKRRKREEIKKEKRAEKIIELFCQQMGINVDEFYNKYLKNLKESSYIYHMFENALLEGKHVLNRRYRIPKELSEKLFEFIEREFGRPTFEIRYKIEAVSWEGDGILRIREFFRKMKELFKKYGKIEIIYDGAPKYQLKIITENPKKFEKSFEKDLKKLEGFSKELKVEFKMERLKK